MKICYETGNLLESSCKIIVHGCNAQGIMGSGIAKAIRAAYPKVYNTYREQYASYGLLLGEVVFVKATKNLWVANGITQEFYGSKGVFVDYDAINIVMEEVNDFARKKEIKEVGLPLIGAGLGGGSWKRISEIIEEQFIDVLPIVYTLDGVIPTT